MVDVSKNLNLGQLLVQFGEIPPGPHIAATPQRYTANFEKYIQRGGLMRPDDDLAGFINLNPFQVYDRARFFFFLMVVDVIGKEKLPGDFVELGVDKGNSASVLAKAAERLGKDIYLLDTFEGFPERDIDGDENLRAAFSDTSLDLVKANVPGDHVKFIKGYFPDSVEQMPSDASFCLAHLDCDLYNPFAAALDYFWPRLAPGGFLIMHDYMSLHWDGVEKACDEFFDGKSESIVPIPDMAGTVVVRKHK
jgi:O-methyltransferase